MFLQHCNCVNALKKKIDHYTAFSKLIWETDPRCQKSLYSP